MNNRLYVENLPPSINEGRVRDLFSKLGTVTEVKLVTDITTGLSRGRAFVTMATPEIAESAIKSLHSFNLEGRNIAVTEARPTEERPTGLIGQGFETGVEGGSAMKLRENGHKKPTHFRRSRGNNHNRKR